MPLVAIVTGSNRGIGPGIVRTLQDHGWQVVSNGRSTARGPGDLHVRADVSTPAGAKRLVAAAKKSFGRLDLLVCGVGDFFETPVSKMEVDRWDELFESNLRTAWLCSKAALPHLRRRGGSLITIGAPAAQTVRANPAYVAYSMAKTALAVFTKSLAKAEARHGVRVNMVNPGYIKTYAYSKADLADSVRRVPAGRLGEPRDIAETVAWLASNAASYVTGSIVDVGGGVGV